MTTTSHTEPTSEWLQDVVREAFDLSPGELEVVHREGVNVVHRFRHGDDGYYAKVMTVPTTDAVSADDRQRGAREAFGAAGVPVVEAVPASTGQVVLETAHGQLSVTREAPGRSVSVMSAAQVAAVADAIARVHRHGTGPVTFVPLRAVEAGGHADAIATLAEGLPRGVTSSTRERLHGMEEAVRRFGADLDGTTLPGSWIHGEIAPSNILFEGDRITCFLDLDAAARSTRLVDYGRGAVFLPRQRRGEFALDEEKFRHFHERFFALSGLSVIEGHALPYFLTFQFFPEVRYFERLCRVSPASAEWFLGWTLDGFEFAHSTMPRLIQKLQKRSR